MADNGAGGQMTIAERGVLHDAVRMRQPVRIDQRDDITMELMESVLMAYPQFRPHTDGVSDDDAVRLLAADSPAWGSVERIIGFADDAVVRHPDDGKANTRWRAHPAHLLKNRMVDSENPSAEMDALSDCAANYLKAAWATSRTLELWLTRQMIFAETVAFGRVAGRPASLKSVVVWWLWAKSVFKWLVGLLVAVYVGEAHGLALGVLTYVVWLAATRFLANDLIDRLKVVDRVYAAMIKSYDMTLRGVICPAEVHQAVTEAEAAGAVWPTGMRSIIERALVRDRAVWT